MITTFEKQSLRERLLNACIAKQELVIDDFKARIKALTETNGLGNEESYDNSDVASNSSKVSEINTLDDLLKLANTDLEFLENLKATQDLFREFVSPGAIVVTNHSTFFISIGLEKFLFEGHGYIGISTGSPLYEVMQGKTKGQTFVFRDVEYKIKDIF